MYFVTCGFCARTLIYWSSSQPASIVFYGEGGAAQELADISGWINVARTAAHAVQMILGDFVLASCLSPLRRIPIDVALIRCYIVYSRRWKVLIPSLILYFGVEAQASLNYAKTTVTSSDIRPWSETFFCITAVQNTLTTGLLIWRIWRVEREMRNSNNHSPFRKVIRVIAESGFAYTLMVFLTFLVDLCNTNLVYCFADLTHQATGIAFNVVIMRTSPSRDEQFTIFAAKGLSAAENGALNPDIDDDDFAVKSADEHQHIYS
ncbi:hypothetical protein B0H14DRAFT_2987437 [Mycena olivaceomarginata]|nr:hypothetical protein B0H14DRAFT_3043827 [Mycena olivaceomarginata]KAJ7743553.1 hypothetical protein B0H14DRAFT_2987437 [Mycena olivaceomarginata]